MDILVFTLRGSYCRVPHSFAQNANEWGTRPRLDQQRVRYKQIAIRMKRMKHLVLAMLLASGQLAFCQGETQDSYAEKLVASIVTAPPHTPILTMQQKAVGRLGDRAAVGLIRHIGAQVPATPQELERILNVIKMAYAVPEAISSDADREPKATSLLLSYLRSLPMSENSKAEVENTRAYVVRQITDYKAKQAAAKNSSAN
jgi:hypothetical protein